MKKNFQKFRVLDIFSRPLSVLKTWKNDENRLDSPWFRVPLAIRVSEAKRGNVGHPANYDLNSPYQDIRTQSSPTLGAQNRVNFRFGVFCHEHRS